MSTFSHYLGIDIGGTSIKWAVVDATGAIHQSGGVATVREQGGAAVVEQIVRLVSELATKFPDVEGIGVGVPGVVHPRTGVVEGLPNFPGWTPQPLAKILSAAAGRTVVVENDANAAAVAEQRCGAGKGIDSFIYVTLGTGVGAAIVIDGSVYTGKNGNAGEIGHTIINAFSAEAGSAGSLHTADVPAYRIGTLEELVGREGILKRAGQGFADVEDIVNGADTYEHARHVLEETGRILGIGIGSAMTLLGIETAIVGGGISQSDTIMDSAARSIKLRTIPTVALHSQLKRAHFVQHAGVVGASMLSLHHSINR